jgi:hypothetical protein
MTVVVCFHKAEHQENVWTELIQLLCLHYLTIMFRLHCLTTAEYVLWFPWLLPWLLSLNRLMSPTMGPTIAQI